MVSSAPTANGAGSTGDLPAESPTGPYADGREAHADIRRLGERRTKRTERSRILDRLRASTNLPPTVAGDLMDSLGRQDEPFRHAIMDVLLAWVQEGTDLSPAAERFAAHLNMADHDLRNKLLRILIQMGPKAKEAELQALGCTRHMVREVRLAGIHVLGSIGSEASYSAIKRLTALQNEVKEDPAMAEAIAGALSRIRPSTPGATPTPTPQPGSSNPAIPRDPALQPVLQVLAKNAWIMPCHEDLGLVLEQIREQPVELRIKALLLGLRSQQESVRSTSARLLAYLASEVAPFLKFFVDAHRKEPSFIVKGALADLITVIRAVPTDPTDQGASPAADAP